MAGELDVHRLLSRTAGVASPEFDAQERFERRATHRATLRPINVHGRRAGGGLGQADSRLTPQADKEDRPGESPSGQR
jgi:hypothetical protein